MIYGISMTQLYRLYYGNRMTQESNIELLAADNHLTQLSAATGGTTFLPRFDTEYPSIYEAMSHQLRNQYNLAFIPTNQKKDGKFHKIKVEVRSRRQQGWQTRRLKSPCQTGLLRTTVVGEKKDSDLDQIALLSQEGSGIAKRIPRGVVPKPRISRVATMEPPPALRATPPH